MQNRNNENISKTPLLRVRHLAVIAVGVALLIAGPLMMVWKQVYITQLSMRRSAVADSASVLAKHAAQLRLSIDRLSASDRIESIARQRLGLEYPAAAKIVIVKQRGKNARPESRGGFFSAWRKSAGNGRG
ncbi:MAG TPA: cell division protein FtsL [Chitinivibrionales bacterium]